MFKPKEAMEFINMLLNIIIPISTFTIMISILPLYIFLKHIFYAITRPVFSEDLMGKVVLITGASSGIGERMAYEYSRRGARLALVGRRENRLRSVASIATLLGCKDVMTIKADVSTLQDCQRMVEETISYYGRLDHLVNNAGITPVYMFAETPDITKSVQTMDTNFWGYVYSSYYAIPYLKRTRGKIVVISSAASWLPAPRLSIYGASKAAVTSFFETLRVEIGTEVGIIIVTPGLVESEITQGKFLTERGTMELNQELRDVAMSLTPVMPATETAKAIVSTAAQGAYYMAVPGWIKYTFVWHVLCPEVLAWSNRFLLLPKPGSTDTDTIGRKIVEALSPVKHWFRPETVDYPELNSE